MTDKFLKHNQGTCNLQTDTYITAFCEIARNRIIKNGQCIFEHPGNAETLFNETYAHFKISYPKFYKMDMLCQLGFLAAEILLEGLNHEKKYGDTETGLILSNAHGSLDVDLKYAKTIQSGASPALFVYTLPNIVIGEIAIRHHFKGENAFFVFKQFDGNFMAGYVNSLFANKLINNCICGWVDLFKENYRAMLYLVETEGTEGAIPFTAENLNHLNLSDYG